MLHPCIHITRYFFIICFTFHESCLKYSSGKCPQQSHANTQRTHKNSDTNIHILGDYHKQLPFVVEPPLFAVKASIAANPLLVSFVRGSTFTTSADLAGEGGIKSSSSSSSGTKSSSESRRSVINLSQSFSSCKYFSSCSRSTIICHSFGRSPAFEHVQTILWKFVVKASPLFGTIIVRLCNKPTHQHSKSKKQKYIYIYIYIYCVFRFITFPAPVSSRFTD